MITLTPHTASLAALPADLSSFYAAWAAQQSPDFAGIVRRWLELDGEPTPAGLGRYLRRLQDRGLKDGTIDQAYRTIRRFIGTCSDPNGKPLPRPKVSWWHYDPDTADRPWFDGAVVAQLAAAARRSPVVTDAARLCLSSLYGLRVSEIARVRPQDVDLAGERLFIRAAKGSRARWCWIPPEARPWLDVTWSPTTPASVRGTLDGLWGECMEAPRPRGAAWHAVRRSVAWSLGDAGVAEADVERFMRWKGGRSMARLYMHPNLRVTVDGRVERPEAQDEGLEAADLEVWARHPYRSLWA